MEKTKLYLTVLIASIVVSPIHSACPSSPSTTAVVTGLFPIHSGDGCSKVNLRTLQQIAALKSTVNSVNSESSSFSINLKIHDTCSSADEAVKAALKALVDPDQMCQNPPFFMGFVGPENVHVLNTVHEVTHVFNTTHLVPFTLSPANVFSDNSVFQVATRKSEEQAQSIITVLRQLKWTSFSLAIDDSHESNLLATALVPLANQESSLCLKGKIAQMTNEESIKSALSGNFGFGTVVLVDSAEKASKVLELNNDINAPLVLVVNEIGLRAWQVPQTQSTTVILQEVSADTIDSLQESLNSSLYSQYITHQDELCKSSGKATECTKNEDILQASIDPSLQPLSYSIRLMASALQSALKAKCAGTKGMCSQLITMPISEWRKYLKESTTFIKQGGKPRMPTILRFQMEIATAFEVYSKESSTLQKIGLITNGKKLHTFSGKSFPASSSEPVLRDTKCSVGEIAQIIPTEWLAHPKTTPSVVLQPVDSHEIEHDLFDLVLLLCGAGLGILIFFLLMTYVVYSSFMVKDDNKSTGGGSFRSSQPISRIAKWRRGSGQSSRASIRSIN